MLDVEVAVKSPEYEAYIKAVCEIQKVNISALTPLKRVCFFLNMYQCMYVHMFFKMILEGRQSESQGSMLSRFTNYVSNRSSQKQFCYNIAGVDYTIDDIKHGMFRGNRVKPGHMLRVLAANDPKTSLLPKVSRVESVGRVTKFVILLVDRTGPAHQLHLPRLPRLCRAYPSHRRRRPGRGPGKP